MAEPGSEIKKRGTDRRGIRDRGLGAGVVAPTKTPMTTGSLADIKAQTSTTAADKSLPPVNVWSHRIGKFSPDPEGIWPYVFKISTLQDLVDHLEKAKLHGRVFKLVIVAHGDAAGLVQMKPNITSENVASFADEFQRLSRFLNPNGMLLFESCQAGLGDTGTLLLTRISAYFKPTQFVVGFMVNGSWIEKTPNQAGDIFEAPDSMFGMPVRELFKNKKRMTEESQYAKWAQNGRVVRLPLSEEYSKLWSKSKKKAPAHLLTRRPGVWAITSAVLNGKNSKAYQSGVMTLTFPESIVLARGKRKIWYGRMTVSLKANPHEFDVIYDSGKNKGKTSRGIFRFGRGDYDLLNLCLAPPSGDRPFQFASAQGSGNLLLEFKRLDPDEDKLKK